MRRIEVDKGKLILTEGVIGFFQKNVTKFGTGAKSIALRIFEQNRLRCGVRRLISEDYIKQLEETVHRNQELEKENENLKKENERVEKEVTFL